MKEEYGIELIDEVKTKYDAIIVAVNHDKYLAYDDAYFDNITTENSILVDIKGIFRGKIKSLEYWSL